MQSVHLAARGRQGRCAQQGPSAWQHGMLVTASCSWLAVEATIQVVR